MTEERINLGKRNFWYWIQLCILSPLWLLHADPKNRKTWSEFKHGLIPHKCDFEDGEIISIEFNSKRYYYKECKHYGCNTVEPIE